MSEQDISGVDVILYRLDTIENSVNKLLSKEVYESEHEALELRVKFIESEITRYRTSNKQMMMSAVSPIIAFILGLLSTIIFM